MRKFLKKYKVIFLIPVIVLLILGAYRLSYRVTFHSLDVMATNANIDRIINKIFIVKLTATKETVNGKISVNYELTFNLPSGTTKQDIEDYVNFALKFSNNTSKIIGLSKSQQSYDYALDPSSSTQRTYNIKFTITPKNQGEDDIKYLLSNIKKDTRILVYNNNKEIKEFEIR